MANLNKKQREEFSQAIDRIKSGNDVLQNNQASRQIAPVANKRVENTIIPGPVVNNNQVAKNILTKGNSKDGYQFGDFTRTILNTAEKFNNRMPAQKVSEDYKSKGAVENIVGKADKTLPLLLQQMEKKNNKNSSIGDILNYNLPKVNELNNKGNELKSIKNPLIKQSETEMGWGDAVLNDVNLFGSTAVTSAKKTGASIPYSLLTQATQGYGNDKMEENRLYTDYKQGSFGELKQQLDRQNAEINGLRTSNIEKTRQNLRGYIDKQNEVIQNNISQASNDFSRKLLEIEPSIIQSGIGAGVTLGATALTGNGGVGKAIGTIFFSESAYTDYYDDAIERGLTGSSANKFATAMAFWEGASEEFITANRLIPSKSVREFAKGLFADVFENFAQEALTVPLQEMLAKASGGDYDYSDLGKRMLSDGFDGALTSLISFGATNGVASSINIYHKLMNNENVTVKELEGAVEDLMNIEGKEVVETQLQIGTQATMNNILQRMVKNIDSVQKNSMQTNELLQNNGQITQSENKISQNANMEQINEISNFARQLKLLKDKTTISEQEKATIKELTNYNMREYDRAEKIRNEKTVDILDKISNMNGNYKTNPKMTDVLINRIKENGITDPIYISNETGKVVDGGHRLLIANELGIDEIPVKYISSANEIDMSKNDWYNILEVELNEAGREEKTDVKIDARHQYERMDNQRSNEINKDRRNSGQSNSAYQEPQRIVDGLLTKTVYGKNFDLGQARSIKTENSNESSFSMRENIAPIGENVKRKQNTILNAQEGQNNEVLQNSNGITSSENIMAKNGNVEQIQPNNQNQVKIDSENFAKQVDDYLSGKMRSNDLINVGKTSQVLQSIGLPNNDIVLKQSKLKKMLQESNDPNSNLHGLSLDVVKRIPEAIATPLNVLQSSSNKNSVVVITDLADKLERPVIASIEMNYEGKIGTIDFLSNRLTSAYGKNNYDDFMKREIAKGNLLYDIDEGIIKELAQTRVQFPASPNSSEETSSINTIIPQNENKMQVPNENIVKNTENSKESSFSMQENLLPIGENVKRKQNTVLNTQEGQNNELLQNNGQITQSENKNPQKANMEQDIEMVNEFNGYSQKEIQNIKSDKIKIAESRQDISNFVQQSKSIPNNFKMYLGKVKQNIADTIKSRLGIDVNNYNISLSADSIRHTIKKHSNVETENARGQIALTAEDFQNIPDIINNPDNIELSGKSKQGKPSIRFEKNINGNNVVITYTSDKHKNLELQTMYKFKNDKKIDSVTASNAEALNTTSETNSDTNLINTIIPQNENKMQVPNENIVKNTENSKESSFSMQENIAPNENERNYLISAQKYNIDTKNETVKSIYEVGERRGLQTIFDDTVFSNSSQNAIWRVNEDGSREVILNPNADTNKTLQSVMVHELVHDFEGSKEYYTLSEMVLEKMQTQEGFEEAIESLKETYSKVYDPNTKNFNEMVEQEAVADFLGENLGNQEFINELVQKQDRNTVQKIYDWVVDKVKQVKNKITGNEEALYWQKVQNSFEKAFSEEYNGNKKATTKFSIQKDSNGNSYVKVDTDQNIFEGVNEKDYNKVAKMYMQDYLIGETDLASNDTAIIDSRSTKKYTNPGQTQYKFEEKMRLTPELRNVLKVAKKTITAGPTKATSKFPKWEYYKFNFEIDGKSFVGNVNIGIDGNGKKHFYEINNIKKTSISETSLNNRTGLSNNIAPIGKNVNRSTKYSMQKTENNTITDTAWQEFLTKNSVNQGKGETIQDVKLPIGENVKRKEKISHRQELSTNSSIYEDENIRAFKIATDNIGKDISTEQINQIAKTGELPDTMGYIVDKRTKPKTSSKELFDSFQQKFVNKGHYIDKLANETGNKELTYKYDRTMNAFNEAQYSIGEEQVNSKGEVLGESLKQIFNPAEEAGLGNEFNDYLLNKHNIARSVVGKGLYGNKVSAPQSSRKVAEYEANHPEFKEWGQKISKYNENNLQDMVDSGMLNQDTFNKLRSLYGDYIPTYRDIIDESIIFDDNSVGGNILGRATGGDQKILAPKEAMAEQTIAIKRAIRINELGIELYNTLGKDSKVFDGIDFDVGAIQSLAGDVIQKAQDGRNTFVIFEDGKMIQFKISDELYTAFNKDTLQARIDNSKLAKAVLTPVEKLSKTQRDLLTTYSVGFAFNNPIKDIQDALFNTKYSVPEFSKNYVKSLYQLGTKGEIYKDYVRNGGNSNTYFDYEHGILPNRNRIQKVIDKIKSVNEILEQAPRLAEYMTTLEHGGTKSEALYNSAEITTNFKRGGEITKVANRYGANFLNASVQGLDKQIRNITGQNGLKGYAHLITRATLLGVAPSILNHLILSGSDDEEYYEDLPDYIKDNYYLFPKGKDGEFYRIPKGRIVATLGTIGRNFTEFAQGEQGLLETVENSIGGIVDNLAPNNPLKDNVASPIVQAKNNKAWYGGEIESTRLQKLPVGERTDEKTDKLSNKISDVLQSNDITKYIADKLGISPKKINYVIDQYSGGIGDVLLPMATPYAENNIFSDKFTTDSVLKNKNVEAFYTELQNAELLNNSEFASDTDKIAYKYLSGISKELGELFAKKREIQGSILPDNNKKAQSRELQAEINKKVKTALNDLENMQINNNSATLRGDKFYKVDGEWKTMSDDEKEKLGNLSLDTYADYKNKTQEAINQKRMEVGKEVAQLNDIEKIKILQSSNYSNKDKDELYNKYVSKNDKVYSDLKNLGMSVSNIDEYLKYKTTEFTSDKEDDGTKSGKTISGSKKEKVISYINNSNFSEAEKIYLIGNNGYSLNDTQRQQFANYVNKLNLSSEQKKQLYLNLGSSNVEELSDGRIRWK